MQGKVTHMDAIQLEKGGWRKFVFLFVWADRGPTKTKFPFFSWTFVKKIDKKIKLTCTNRIIIVALSVLQPDAIAWETKALLQSVALFLHFRTGSSKTLVVVDEWTFAFKKFDLYQAFAIIASAWID